MASYVRVVRSFRASPRDAFATASERVSEFDDLRISANIEAQRSLNIGAIESGAICFWTRRRKPPAFDVLLTDSSVLKNAKLQKFRFFSESIAFMQVLIRSNS